MVIEGEASPLGRVAAGLRRAYADGRSEEPPYRFAAEDADDAYAVQEINNRFWLQAGRTLSGRKIGLTSSATQAQLGANRPNYGLLFADTAIEDGGEIAFTPALRQPRAEAEVALLLERDITSPEASSLDVLRSVACVTAAIEIVDSRAGHWQVNFADMVADNGFAARYVLSRSAKSILGLDLLTCGMMLEVNGRVASLGAGAACLGHPLNAAAWLARSLARTDRPLRAGEVIMTGALGPMVPVSPGDVVDVRIGGVGAVRVALAKQAIAAD